jgi:hypothetical protein
LRHSLIAFPRGLFLCAVLLLAAFAGTLRPGSAEETDQPSVESIKVTIEQIEQAVGHEDATAEELAEARQKLNAAADALRTKIEELEPRLQEIAERLKQLGPAPEKDQPPEGAEVAKERQELAAALAEVEGALKQARVLLVHVDQLSERVAEKRHVLYARELFARNASALDPFFWVQVFHALPIEITRGMWLIENWKNEQKEAGRLAAALIILLALAAGAIAVSWRWHAREPRVRDPSAPAKAWRALRVFAFFALRTPLPSLAGLLLLDSLGLLNFRVEQIAEGIVAGICRCMFRTRGRARALCHRQAAIRAGAGRRCYRALFPQSPGLGLAHARACDCATGGAQNPVRAARRHDRDECTIRPRDHSLPDSPGLPPRPHQARAWRGAARRRMGSSPRPAHGGAHPARTGRWL